MITNQNKSRGVLVLLITIIFLAMPTTLSSATPTPGNWEGTTNYGNEMSFDVSGDSTQWSNFKLKAVFFGGSLSITITVPGGSIENGEFDWSNSAGTYFFSGEFTSETTATGTYNYNNYYVSSIGVYVSQSGTWTASLVSQEKDDLLGTWTSQGVYYRNSDTGAWEKMATPATQITAGDLDEDGIDDLIGIWPTQGGVWVKYSSSDSWSKLSTTADWIAGGDMNGDGRDDFLGTWPGQGVYYKDSATETWVMMATPATQITAGDLDNDGTDDLIGIWPAQGGVWVKYSSSGSWAQLSSTADWIACGDMNGDGWDDLLGTWTGQGVYYKNSAAGNWIKMATPATQIAAGDLDGDGTDDLLGIWPGQGGVWVKYSSDETWERLSSTADWIACGKMRGVGSSSSEVMKLSGPFGGFAQGPGWFEKYEDLSNEGPGGWNFAHQEEEALVPREEKKARMQRVPGPGEPGFKCIEQKNLIPVEGMSKEGDRKKK